MDIDGRLAAHVDGLRVAGEDLWSRCDSMIAPQDPGEAFLAGVLAIEGQQPAALDALFTSTEPLPSLSGGLRSSFGWVSAQYLTGTVKRLLAASLPSRRVVGIACCAMHGVDPGERLTEAVTDAEAPVAVAALRAAGELGRRDLSDLVERSLSERDGDRRAAAARAAVLLGNRGAALDALQAGSATVSTPNLSPMLLALQALSLSRAHSFLQTLGDDRTLRRQLIQGSGIAGDPSYVTWLVNQMADPKTARLAAHAFSLITGADLGRLKLEGAEPKESPASAELEDLNVAMDPDDDLPWPDVPKIEEWWAANSTRFQKGVRYFVGAPVTREHCIEVLKNGYQRQRILAAHYLCLLEPGTPLFNTSAPAWRQRRLLATMS